MRTANAQHTVVALSKGNSRQSHGIWTPVSRESSRTTTPNEERFKRPAGKQLSQQFFDDTRRFDADQALVQSLIGKRELIPIEAQQMQNRAV